MPTDAGKARNKRLKTVQGLKDENERLNKALVRKRAMEAARKKLIDEGYRNVGEM